MRSSTIQMRLGSMEAASITIATERKNLVARIKAKARVYGAALLRSRKDCFNEGQRYVDGYSPTKHYQSDQYQPTKRATSLSGLIPKSRFGYAPQKPPKPLVLISVEPKFVSLSRRYYSPIRVQKKPAVPIVLSGMPEPNRS